MGSHFESYDSWVQFIISFKTLFQYPHRYNTFEYHDKKYNSHSPSQWVSSTLALSILAIATLLNIFDWKWISNYSVITSTNSLFFLGNILLPQNEFIKNFDNLMQAQGIERMAISGEGLRDKMFYWDSEG